MTAERQGRPALEHRPRIGSRPAIGVEADTQGQPLAALSREQDLALRHDARRLVPNQRQPPRARAGKRHRAGAEQLALPAPYDNSLPTVYHGQRDKPFDRKRLDVGPDGGEVVRIADSDRSNPLSAA